MLRSNYFDRLFTLLHLQFGHDFRPLFLQEGFQLVILAFLLQNPIELAVVGVAFISHDLFEQTAQIVVVWLLFELEIAAVLNVLHELFRHSHRQLLHSCLALLFLYFIVLLVFIFAC